MIKSITVINYRGDTLTIGMGNLDQSGFLITSIEGLSPSKATINATKMATGDGSIFNSSRLEPRNIVMSMLFNPDMDVEQLRLKSYKYFSVKRDLTLIIETDFRKCQVHGYVESNEVNIFSRQEGAQISIICPDPYLYAYGLESINHTSFSSTVPNFEFPFSNESLTEPIIEFSIINIVDKNTVYYSGDAEIGITIRIRAFAEIGDIRISKLGTDELMTINADKIVAITGSRISRRDEVIICTERNAKSVQLLRNGRYYNILNSLDRKSTWFKIDQGDNIFTYSADGLELDMELSIDNRTIYEGV